LETALDGRFPGGVHSFTPPADTVDPGMAPTPPVPHSVAITPKDGSGPVLPWPAAQAALRTLRSEKVFSETMIESMPGVLYLYDAEGAFLRWNRNFEEATGYSPEEIAAMHPLDFFAGDKAAVAARIQEVFEYGESSVEAELVAKDGTAKPYFFTGRRFTFEGKVCLMGVGIDISARKRAEASLAVSERKYRELVQHANSIILRWNAEGRVTFLNEFGQRFFGYAEHEIVGAHVLGTIVPDVESGGRDLARLMEQICAEPQAFEQNTNENVRRNGERVWIAWTNRIVRDASGKLVEILSVGTDVTAKVLSEAARREAEIQFRTLFEQTPVAVVVLDWVTGVIVEANQQAAKQVGYSTKALCGMRASEIALHGDAQIDALRRDGYVEYETRHCTREGDLRDVFVSARRVRLKDRSVVQCVLLDVTDRKRIAAEQELRHRAESADRVKSAFLATMSHELRTPLNSIIGFTGIMRQGLAGPVNDEQSKQLDMVRRSALHLLALVNDVLDISKIEAGQLEVAIAPFDLRDSLEKVVTSVQPQAAAKGILVRSRVSAAVAAGISDARRFEQIVLNLLSNAIKFTEHGEVSVTADIVPGSERVPMIRVSVSDTGIGIRPEDLSLLFEPFRQIDSGLSRRHEGTGLGLAICQRLARLLGGDIGATSVWNQGSTFVLTLPLQGFEPR